MSRLYRSEAIKARHTNWLGDIILVRPLSFTYLTICMLLFAGTIVAFMMWGSYTKRSTVMGQLIPDTGLLRIYVPQPGIVLQKFVVEGQRVRRGDVLYILSSERHSSTQGDIQATISSQVEVRQQSLREELNKTRALQGDEHQALSRSVRGISDEVAKVKSQIEGQKNRVKLAVDSISRYQGLLQQEYISREQVQQKEEDLLDQSNRLQSLEREYIRLARELATQQNELATLSLRQQNQLAQLERSITSTSQELTESEAKRRLVISAPQAGVATAVSAQIGQAVDSSKPLVSVVPTDARLQAHLYAPSKAIGFIKPGDKVLLRYQSFPYEKFGHAQGHVLSVSKTALPASEAGGTGDLPSAGSFSEPLYRITVGLEKQTVKAYGKPEPLQAGMTLSADVLQESRRLYEWVLEPLYSLTGKL